VYRKKKWKEVFNSNDAAYWGTGNVFNPEIKSTLVDKATNCYRITLNLPPLAAIILK
jgi:1,4-alpha-glucan branching enzyme